MRLDEFNTAPPADVEPLLLACCDTPAWAGAVTARRPYASRDDLLAEADRAARGLASDDVDSALAAHPRIGKRAPGTHTASRWSRQEQGAVSEDTATRDALSHGNRAYERRFDRVFLVCATGLSAGEILENLHTRLRNDDAAEAAVVHDELRKIALLRLRKAVDP